MMKRYLFIWTAIIAVTVLLSQVALARKLKVYRLPNAVYPGQLATVIFENPDPDHNISRSKCTADRMMSWMKSDVPIIRIEQNGKQIWTSLGSYQSIGDSCIASFMAPVICQPGKATFFLVNGTDASIPYYFTIAPKVEAILAKVEGVAGAGNMKPLTKFRVVGEGFVPEGFVDEKGARAELEQNIGLSKLSPAEQWTELNRRIMKDWDKLAEGNFLYLEQGGKTWRCFVENCGIELEGMSLEFTAPPDIQPGSISVSLGIRMNNAEVFRTQPITATVSN